MRAFTLIEMLVVVLLLAFITSIVGPAGYRLMHSVQHKLDTQKAESRRRHKAFEAFIGQRPFPDLNISQTGVDQNDYATRRYHD